MTTRNVACNTFAEVWKNTSTSQRQVTFDAPTECGGVTTLGLYETANNALKDLADLGGNSR